MSVAFARVHAGMFTSSLLARSVCLLCSELMDYLNEFKVPEWRKMVEQDLVDTVSSEDDE